MNNSEPRYSIGKTAELTGVKPVTLRAWETRYGFLTPHKTETGHRQYSDDDIVRIKEVLFWLEKGVKVGKVEQYLQNKLRPGQEDENSQYLKYQEKAIAAVQNFDQVSLDKAVSQLFSLYPLDIISQRIYPNVLQALSKHWLSSDTAFSEQQFFSFYLRNKIASQFLTPKPARILGKILLATLEQTFTELELLFLAAALSNYGFEIVLLGTHSLPQEWPAIIERADCMGMVLSTELTVTQTTQIQQLAERINRPICIRTRTQPKITHTEEHPHVHWLPENYHQLLAGIHKIMTEAG